MYAFLFEPNEDRHIGWIVLHTVNCGSWRIVTHPVLSGRVTPQAFHNLNLLKCRYITVREDSDTRFYLDLLIITPLLYRMFFICFIYSTLAVCENGNVQHPGIWPDRCFHIGLVNISVLPFGRNSNTHLYMFRRGKGVLAEMRTSPSFRVHTHHFRLSPCRYMKPRQYGFKTDNDRHTRTICRKHQGPTFF